MAIRVTSRGLFVFNFLNLFFLFFILVIAMSSVDEFGRDNNRRERSTSRRSRRDRSPTRRWSRSRSHRSRSYRRRSSPSLSRSRERSHRHHRSRSPLRVNTTKFSKHEVADDLSEDESGHEDDDDEGRYTSRAKKLKRIDVENPLSAFATKTKTRLGHIPASDFAKSNWNTIRGMDPVSGKFLVQDRPKPDDWLKMAKSDRLINKWSGDPAFADTRLDDGLSSVIPKSASKEETDLMKTQRAIGAIGHMVLSASEGFSKLYAKMGEFVVRNIGNPSVPNPEYEEKSDVGSVPKFIYAEWQNAAYAEFQELQREWQLDVSEPLAIAARTTAATHIKIMAVRREKVVAKIANVNQKAANAISKIPPSAHGMFGGDAAELEKVVKLARDLGGSARQPFQGTSATHNNYNNKRGGGYTKSGRGFTPRGGGSSRGVRGGFRNARGRGSKNSTRGN